MADDDEVSRDAAGRARAFLTTHGAAKIPHVGGGLLPHLLGTSDLLREWGAPNDLRLAALVHTAYGTDGFPHAFVSSDDRAPLREMIGDRAEELAYFYCSCDRAFLYPRIVNGAPGRVYRDRFADRIFEPDEEMYRAFLELTFANELEIFRRLSLPLAAKQRWRAIFAPCRGLVSDAAFAAFVDILGEDTAA
jgi:uncharacterized protein DUF6817